MLNRKKKRKPFYIRGMTNVRGKLLILEDLKKKNLFFLRN